MDNVLKKRIMRRIYAIYILRKIFSNIAFKIYIGAALLYGVKVFVNIAAVADNMPKWSNVAGLYNFMSYSIINTELAVQFIVFGLAALIIWMMRDALKSIFAREIRGSIRKVR